MAEQAVGKDQSHKDASGGMNGTALHRFVRRLVPSGATLTFNPAFKFVANTADMLPRALVPGFRRLPPNHLRVRVGVGDQVFTNHLQFYYSYGFWFYALNAGWVTLDSNIVDLGCGCGRYAHHMRDLNLLGKKYSGKYIGIDIDAEAIAWDKKHYDDRFEFLLSTDNSETYSRKDGDAHKPYQLPIADGSVDFIFSTSLFTHLLEPELRNYMKESARTLRPGGIASHSVFCLDYPPPTYGTRHTFKHPRGEAFIESEASPEAAVAYTEAFLVNLAKELGFDEARIVSGPGVVQPHFVCRRGKD
jgi:SAM-dependent methyltransferase